jgi:hypothetical protein
VPRTGVSFRCRAPVERNIERYAGGPLESH